MANNQKKSSVFESALQKAHTNSDRRQQAKLLAAVPVWPGGRKATAKGRKAAYVAAKRYLAS